MNNFYYYLIFGMIVILVILLYYFSRKMKGDVEVNETKNVVKSNEESVENTGKLSEVLGETYEILKSYNEKFKKYNDEDVLTPKSFSNFTYNINLLMDTIYKNLTDFSEKTEKLRFRRRKNQNKSQDYSGVFNGITQALVKISDDMKELNETIKSMSDRISKLEGFNETSQHDILLLRVARIKATIPKGIAEKQVTEKLSKKTGLTKEELSEVLNELKDRFTA